MLNRQIAAIAFCGLCLFNLQTLAAVGRTAGHFTVSANGAGTYKIPIGLPPGPHGIQPNLAIVYNSQAGVGSLGPGWQIAGLSSIARCNQTVAQDTTAAPVTLTYSDRFCLDGQRLRLTSSETLSTYGQDMTTYQTEVANFSNVTAHGVAGNGPAYFTVQGKNGLIYEYGNVNTTGNANNNSQVIASGTSTVLQWLLDKVSDRNGNNYVIAYSAPNSAEGVELPTTMSYTPTSAGATSYSYTVSFAYGTRVNQNPNTHTPAINGQVAGSTISNPNLLSTITLAYSGTTIQQYNFGYTASATTSQALLTSVTQCGGSGGTDCLSPTNISYQSGAAGVASAVTAVSGTLHVVAARDFNHDGREDILYTNGSTLYVAFATASGFSTPVQVAAYSGLTAEIAYGDLLGAGQADIMIPVSNVWWRYTYNGSAFVGSSTGITLDANVNFAALTDIDGDGLADLVTVSFNGSLNAGSAMYIFTRHNNSTSGTLSFASTETSTRPPACIGSGNSAQPAKQVQPLLIQDYSCTRTVDANGGLLSSLHALDFNGDGRKDLMLFTYNYLNGTFIGMTNYVMLSNGSGFTPILAFTEMPPFVYLNANNDRCTDVAVGTYLFTQSCNGVAGSTTTLASAAVGAIDWDGDGRDDLLTANGADFGVMESTGSGATAVISTSVPYSSNSFFVFDQNGDGLGDLGFNPSAGGSITYSLHNGAGSPPDLVSSIADGFGNSASPTYVSIAQYAYVQYSDASYPYQNYIGPLYVVNEAILSDPSAAPGGTYNFQYTYYGAWSNVQGRGFQSFYSTRTTDSRNGTVHVSYFERAFPLSGMLFQDDRLQPDAATKMLHATYTPTSSVLDSTANNQRTFAYDSSSSIQAYEVGGSENGDLISTTSTNYTFDAYGNTTNIVTTVTDNDPGSPYSGATWTTNVTNTTDISANASADLAAWCLPLLDATQIVYSSTLSGSTSVTRTQTYTPDNPAACRIKTIVTEPNSNSGLFAVTEALGFDSFGNINSDTLSGANMPASPASRVTLINWGNTGQFLTTVTDPSGAVTTWTYSSTNSIGFGVPDSIKNANNLTTSWTYDDFGRKIQEIRPDNTLSTWNRTPCTSYCGWSNSVYQIAQTAYQTNGTTAIRTDTLLYDPIDRVSQTSGPTVTGAIATVRSTYNALGLLYQKSVPFLGTTQYNSTYSYDLLNRVVSVSRPISATNQTLQSTTYQYAGRTRSVLDPYSHKTSLIFDVNGWQRQTKDALGYAVTQSYDAAGSLTGITDSVGNTLLSGVTYKYGIKPFRVADTDADRGAWSYTFDSLGELTGWVDAKGQSFSATYDSLSRPLTRTEPDQFSQWTYGSTPASFNVGQLIAECASNGAASSCGTTPAYSETRTFDSTGRPWKRAITELGITGNDPGSVFLFTTTYSTTTGLPNTLTYPISTSGVALNLQYGFQYGLLQTVTDTTDTTSTCGSTCTLWTANASNAFGQITQQTLGNNVVMKRTYDAVTSWLSSASGGVGGGSGLLNQSYAQDENGNVTQRQNNNLGLTENFFYDADNRLTCATLTSSCSSPTFAYDGGAAGPGNITTQAGVGTYTYPAPGQPRPHAVTSITGTFNGITNPAFAYDANGNMIKRAASAQNITWSSSNYPSAISANDVTAAEEVHLYYGPDRQRWRQLYTALSTTENTYYLGGLIDLVYNGGTTDYRHYIYAGGTPIAVYSRTAAGVNTMSYMLQDHQGGVSAITSKSGAADVNESFSAFGTRRNPTTWSGAPSSTDLNTIAGLSRQGYTFQTWLGQSMGLNHMNGRVQDAIMGRFLSPDTHVPDPSNAQSYNRYSYVNNNPLTLMDPTGFDAICDDGCGGSGTGNGTISAGGVDLPLILPDLVDLPLPDPLPIAAPPPAQTGSMIPGVDTGATCYGNCGVYATFIQVPNSSAPEQVTVTNNNGTGGSAIEDADAGAVPEMKVEAPGYHWVQTDSYNLAPFAAAATTININSTLLQAFGYSAGFGVGAGIVGPPIATAALARLPQLPSRLAAQLLAKTMEMSYPSQVAAAEEIIGAEETSVMEEIDQLSEILKAEEIEEAAGPELPWPMQ